MTDSTAFWYASRATGVVALVLLTVVFAIGITINRQARVPGLPRFAVTDLHRNLSLLTVTFLCTHVLTAVLDTYVSITPVAIVVPFASGYERFWLGLGAIAFDVMVAIIATSLLRGRLNRAAWRAIHLTAYLCWPIAFLHGLYASGDLRRGPLLAIALGCALVVAAAVTWRLASAARRPPRAGRVAAGLAAAEHRPRPAGTGQAARGPRR
ncbi:MAG TPA: ferric reductase-like transmembrane domain-containing protein [Trebonia sp.]|nr:ferric reductase-like transmembrane domain-containing protein [Trebonia sp.]